MAKVRLNQAMRDRLVGPNKKTYWQNKYAGESKSLATDCVAVTLAPYEVAIEKAYKKAEPLVRKAVAKKYPPKDMAVLKKHDVGYQDDCIKVVKDPGEGKMIPSGDVVQFNFKKDTGPYVAKRTYSGVIYPVDEVTDTAVAVWIKANEDLSEAKKQKKNDYVVLVRSSTYLEEVEAFWPEAGTIRNEMMTLTTGKALVPVAPEVIARIQADVAAREKLQKKTAAVAMIEQVIDKL